MNITPISNNKIEKTSFSATTKRQIKPSKELKKVIDKKMKSYSQIQQSSNQKEGLWVDSGIKEGVIVAGVIAGLACLIAIL